MCIKTKCKSCGKITWEGCGNHVKEILKNVPRKSLCSGWKNKKCPENKSYVLNIKYKNLKKINKSNKIWMILFYYPQCYYCKKIFPIWEKLAKKLRNKHKIKFCKVNCYIHKKLRNYFSIEKYPTIKLFYPKQSKKFTYKGSHNYRRLYQYARKKLKQYSD